MVAAGEREEAPDSGEQDADPSPGWPAVLLAASRLGPGLLGITRWIDMRAQAARPDPMHGLDPWWDGMFGDYFASGKRICVCRKGLRAGGSSSAMVAVLAVAIGANGPIDPSVDGVVAILSSSRDEATDRFRKLRKLLRACGIGPEMNAKGTAAKSEDEADEEAEVMPGGIGGIYRSKKSMSGGGIVEVLDRRGQSIQFRILPAMRRSVIGWTGRAVFLDETSMWPDDPETHINPASEIIKLAIKRCTTQTEARIFIFSATYQEHDAHAQRVDLGDTSAQFIARLGDMGAARDEEARRSLAALIGSTDPRLLEPGDPRSPNIGAWVGNPSKSPIVACYRDSDDHIGDMLGLYGGRPAEHGKREEGGEEWAVLGVEHRNADCMSEERGYR